MSKFKYYFILSIITLTIFSCSKSDNPDGFEAPREYAVQYKTDSINIEKFLKENYITITDAEGQTEDKDVTFTKIPQGGQQASIWSYLNNSGYPKLLTHKVEKHDITYTVYYLLLREGQGDRPCNTDQVFAAYRGLAIGDVTDETTKVTEQKATQFEENKYPTSYLPLLGTIGGWQELFPKLKTGTISQMPDGIVKNENFGASIFFIPSGLAYYNQTRTSIPAYSPLIFITKLYQIKRTDSDLDGIPDYLEDIDGDGYVRETITGKVNLDDTDGDGIPDYRDADDDNDGQSTKFERIKSITNGVTEYYSFDEIPTCTTGGKKRHLDPACKRQ